MEISKLDATAASVAGRVLRVRDPRHLRGDSDVDKRPFLLSDDASYVTGQNIEITGGST